jgi:hypothetical protein
MIASENGEVLDLSDMSEAEKWRLGFLMSGSSAMGEEGEQ